jgi:cobalt-zinc-cadmium efflux system protein
VHRPRQRRALLICVALTTAAMFVEIAGGLWTNSLMLLSDAAHMLSHALALGISYAAVRLAGRAPSARSHYGLFRAEILGALVNGLGLLVFTAWIGWEAIERMLTPEPILGAEMTLIAIFGLAVNVGTAVILHRAGAEDLNTRSAFLHMLGDTLSSVAIVAGGVVVWATSWTWIDPVLSVLVALVILWWSIGLLRQSASILLERTPAHLDANEVRTALVEEVDEVLDVHDLHLWEITSGYVCMTAHLVVRDLRLSETHGVRAAACELVRERYHVGHATLQMEAQRMEAEA